MQLGIYIFISLVTVFFVACTVHFTYKDNVEGSKDMRPSDLIKILVQYLQYHMIIGCVTVPWPAFFGPLFRISETIFGVTSVSSMALPCWVPFYTRAPRDKIPGPVRMQLVMFMAPLLVFLAAVVLRLLWWAVRTGFMALYGGSSGASSAANASSCASPSCVRIMQPPTARLELRKLPVTALIVLFYAYPTLLLTSMMFFACLPIDKAATGSPATLMDNKHGYYQVGLWVGRWWRAATGGVVHSQHCREAVRHSVCLRQPRRQHRCIANSLCTLQCALFSLPHTHTHRWTWSSLASWAGTGSGRWAWAFPLSSPLPFSFLWACSGCSRPMLVVQLSCVSGSTLASYTGGLV